MKRALVDGQLIPATADAPEIATCPHCERVVRLRNRQGTYFWRHVRLPLGGCEPPVPPGATLDATEGVGQGTRRVGPFAIELHLDPEDRAGHHLELRNPSAEEVGAPSGMIIYPSEVRPLAAALLEALADLAGLAVGDQPSEES